MSIRTKAVALGRLMRGDREKRWVVAERVARAAHPEAILGEYAKSWPHDEAFVAALQSVPATPRQLDRVFTLDQLAAYAARFDGDFAECGTYTGVSASFLCRRAAAAGKRVALFDSWEGLSEPTAADGTYWASHDLSSPIAVARNTLRDYDNAEFFQGWIPDRFDEVADRRFSLVHVDVDLRDPTLAALEFFFPRLVVGGVFVCDDYGFDTCPGARAAVDGYCAAAGESVIHLPTGQGLVIRTAGHL